MIELDRRRLLALMAAGSALAGTGTFAQESQSDESIEGELPFAELAMGDENAPVTMIEYASLTCPHCASFHNNVLPQLTADYIDTGKVRLIYREVYFDGPGLWAALIARCGGPDRYFGLLKLLYERQPEWSRASSQAELVQGLFSIGRMAGLTEDEMTACLQNKDNARAMVETYQEAMERDGITGTPSFSAFASFDPASSPATT